MSHAPADGQEDDGFQVVGPSRRQNRRRRTARKENQVQHENSKGKNRQRPKHTSVQFPPFLENVVVPELPTSFSAEDAVELGWSVEEAQAPCLLILMGLVGSGKSTAAQKLESLLPRDYVRINQDELGNRQRCLDQARGVLEVGRSSLVHAHAACPVIDRCHMSRSQRKYFLDLAREFDDNETKVAVDCIWFQTDPETCLERCRKRQNHPTLAPSKVPMVLGAMQKEFEALSEREGFRFIHQVHDEETFANVLQLYVNRVVVGSMSNGGDDDESNNAMPAAPS